MEFPNRLLELRNKMGLTQEQMALRLGLKANYISILERGGRAPSEAVIKHVELIEKAYDVGLYGTSPAQEAVVSVKEDPGQYNRQAAGLRHNLKDPTRHHRRIPVLSFAHAGKATSYEEIPKEWQETVPTDCPDPKAFALILEGDSMPDEAREGDVLVVMPSYRAHSGSLAVVRLATDDIYFRRIQVRPDAITLIPSNPLYDRDTVKPGQISWIYPTYGAWRQHWKGPL